MFLLLTHLAAAAEITVYTQTPAAVSVDGQLLEYDEGSLLLVVRNVKGGKHTVKVESLARSPITQMDVTVQQSERIDLVYGQRTIGKVGAGLVGEPAVTARYAQIAAFGSGASASFSVSDGMGGGVTMTAGGPGRGPAYVVVQAPLPPVAPPVVAPAPPTPPKPEPVEVVFSLKDSFDMSNVYVDGRRVAEFRTGDQEKSVTLMSGTHTVEVKDFTEFHTWFKGTLNVTPGEPIRFGYGEDAGVEVYNRPGGVWTQK